MFRSQRSFACDHHHYTLAIMTDKGLEDLPEGMFAGLDALCLFFVGSVAVFMVAMVRGDEREDTLQHQG